MSGKSSGWWMAAITLVAVCCGNSFVFAQSQPAAGVLMLTSEPQSHDEHPVTKKYAIVQPNQREIPRQALLLAARHEFDLLTRDESLGEPVDPASPDCIRATTRSFVETSTEAEFFRSGKSFFKGDVKLIADDLRIFRDPLEWAEGISRTELPAALERAGYVRRPLKKNPAAKVPEDLARQLEVMDHVSMFAAVRRLHALLREQGESPEIIGALSRAYTHLAYLTQHAPDCRTYVFHVRAALYAQRLVALQPESPWGYWHRAYVFIVVGFRNQAQADLAKAVELGGKFETAPEWVRLTDFAWRYKIGELQKVATQPQSPVRQAAAVFWILSNDFSTRKQYRCHTAKQALEVAPHCLNFIAEMGDAGDEDKFREASELTVRTHALLIDTRLREVSDLPNTIRTALITFRKDAHLLVLANLAQVIMRAGRSDSQEFSWSILGSTIQQWNAEPMLRRAWIDDRNAGGDYDDYLKKNLTAVEGTVYQPILVALALPSQESNAAMLKFPGTTTPFPNLNSNSMAYRVVYRLPKSFQLGQMTQTELTNYVYASPALTEYDFYWYLERWDEATLAKQLRQLQKKSTESPAYPRERILGDYRSTDNRRAQWTPGYGEHPDFHWAIARGGKLAGDFESSLAAYKIYLEKVPYDAEAWIAFADAYHMSGDTEHWRPILEHVLELEDFNQSHFKAEWALASTLQADGQFAAARPWAERASEFSWLGRNSLVSCLVAQGDLEAARELIGEETDSFDWYRICVVHNLEGAQAEADRLLASWSAQVETFPSAQDGMDQLMSVNHFVTGDFAASLARFQQAFDRTPATLTGIMTALLAEKLNRRDLRDEYLKKTAEIPTRAPGYSPVSQLATLLLDSTKTGTIDEAKYLVLRRTKFEDDFWEDELDMYLGYWLMLQGQRETGLELIKRSACQDEWDYTHLLACAVLRSEGIDHLTLEGRQLHGGLRGKWKPPVSLAK